MKRWSMPFVLLWATASAWSEPGVHWDLQDVAALSDLMPATEWSFDAADYADAPVVHALVRTETEFGRDAITERVLRIDRYNTLEGVQQYSNDTIYWEADAQTVTIRRAAVITADGSLRAFDPDDLRIVDTDTYDVFTDQRELLLSLPGLEKDSWTVIEFERVTPRGLEQAPWQGIRYLQGPFPSHRLEYVVRWDDSVGAPAWAQRGDLLVCSDITRGIRCINPQPIPIMTFDDAVNYYDVLPHTAFGEATSWEDIAALVRRGVNAAVRDSEPADRVFESLTAGLSSREEVIAALHAFVAREIRYRSLSEGRHDIFPHPVATTLENRYGDCKDKSALLLALLERAGLTTAEAVLVSTRREDPAGLLLPGIAYFDHMVVCWQDPDGSRRCLDPTDAYSPADETPAALQGRVALGLGPDPKPHLIPSETYRWRMSVEADLSFDSTGSQQESSSLVFDGAYGGARRAVLAGWTPDERRLWAMDEYRRVVSDQARPEVSFDGIGSLTEPLRVRFAARYDSLVNPDEPLDYRENDAWSSDLIEYFIAHNEHYPYAFPGLAVSSTYRYRADGGWSITETGAELDFEHPFGQLRRSYAVEEGEVTVTTRLTIPRRIVPVAEMEEFRRFLRLLQRELQMRFAGRFG